MVAITGKSTARAAVAVIAGILAVAGGAPVQAQDVPPDLVRIIVPYSPGGAGDVMARAVARTAAPALGRRMIVENRPGASGMIAAASVARARGDRSVLLLGSSGELAINPSLYKTINYDPRADFQPVTFAGKLPLVLVAPQALPYWDLSDVLAAAARNPDQIAFGSAGAGQVAHLAMEFIMQQKGVKMLHVPYKGGSEVVTAVLSGQVQLFFSGMPPALPHVAGGTLRALAISTTERVKQLPEVPTVAERDVPGFDIYNWFAFFAPAGVPASDLEKIGKAVDDAIETAELKSIWDVQGIVAQRMTAAQLGTFVIAEAQKYKALIETANIKID